MVLVETADCCGGGAAGDSVACLAALLRHAPTEPSLVPVVDAEAASLSQAAGAGGQVALQLGHKHDSRWGKPIPVQGRVLRVFDGRFTYSGGIWDGVEGNMGPAAVLQLGAIEVLVTTYGTYDWRDEQFNAAGMEPEKAKFVVAKNPMNFTQTYGHIAAAMLVLDTPGPTPATMRHAPLAQIERPYYPADAEMELGEIVVLN